MGLLEERSQHHQFVEFDMNKYHYLKNFKVSSWEMFLPSHAAVLRDLCLQPWAGTFGGSEPCGDVISQK